MYKDKLMHCGRKRIHLVSIETSTCRSCCGQKRFVIDTVKLPLMESAIDYCVEKADGKPTVIKLIGSVARVEVIVSNKTVLCQSCSNRIERILRGVK